MLFAKANPNQARVMKKCIDIFYEASGQTINFDKSTIFYFSNTYKEIAKEISLICGPPFTDNLGRYLGMSLLYSRITKSTYASLISMVHARLVS